MAENPAPYVNINLGKNINNERIYIKKGTVVKISDVNLDNPNIKPITLFNNNIHRVTNWAILEESPEYTYNKITKSWSLKGLDNKYESYFIELPEDFDKWIKHLSDFTFEMTLNITNDKTLKDDGTTGDIASLFSWKNIYENTVVDKPEWPSAQEYIKLDRGIKEYSFGNDTFYKSINSDKNMKYSVFNKIYWRFEREPYKDFYPEGDDFDGDFKYPNENDFRICRGWKNNVIKETKELDEAKRFILSNDMIDNYNNDWNINNWDRVQTPIGNKIRIKLFNDKNGNVLNKYVFKDINISATNSYYTYYKNINNLQDLSVSLTNNTFKHWSKNNYSYSMFTRKTEKLGNTTIQNSGTKMTNRLSQMQRMWIAFSGGRNLKSEDGNNFQLTNIDDKMGRSLIINTLSPIQQLLWVSWHLTNLNGSWKKRSLPGYKEGILTANNINYFITQFLWSWQTLFEIMPLSNNNLNTDKEINELGNKDTNKQTYYNKNFYYEIIKELKGWPIPIIKSLSNVINDWIPPEFELTINNSKEHIKLLSTDINKFNEAQSIITENNRLNLFYTIPSNTIFLKENWFNYMGNYENNHSMNFINLIHFVNRLNYEKIGNGWFSKEGYIKEYSIPIAGKNNDGTRISSDNQYMYRINDTPKENNIRGIYFDKNNNKINGTLRKHNGLLIKLPEIYSKYSIPWHPINYIPKIKKIRIELDFSIRQCDENINISEYPISSILSTNYKKPLVYLRNSIKRDIEFNVNKNNGWKHSGLMHAESDYKKLNIINILNDSKIKNNFSTGHEFLDNGRYKIIYEIDNLPIMNPGENKPKIDPLKSGLLVQIDYTKSQSQKNLGLQTIRGNNTIASNGNNYDGKDGKPNYSMTPTDIGSIFKDDGPFSFSIHKKDLYGLMSEEQTKKHLGFYLFTGDESSSSYYFKDIKVKLDIPELELEKAIEQAKGTETLIKISKLEQALEKANKEFAGVIDNNLILKAQKRLSVMKILINNDEMNNLKTNQRNIDNLQRTFDNLINIDITDDEFKKKIQIKNKIEIMKMDLKLINIVNNPSIIKEINNILLDVDNQNINEIYIDTNLTLNLKEEKVRLVSLRNKKDIEKEITFLKEKRLKLINDYTKELITFKNKFTTNDFGDGLLGQYILLKQKLIQEGYNKGELSIINVTGTDLSPINHLKSVENIFLKQKTTWIDNLNKYIFESSKKENLYKLIDFVLKGENEEIEQIKDGKNGLEGRYFEAKRKIINTIDELKLEWNIYRKNNQKKELWFNWLGDIPPLTSWKGTVSLNLFEIKENKEYVKRIINNLNLKIANDFSVPIKIKSDNKGKINKKNHVFKFPLDPEIYINKSTQAFRVNWQTNKYIKSFIDEIWIGTTEDAFKKTSNILGQKFPWNTPMGFLMKSIETNSQSFIKLITLAKNGSPNNDRWHFPIIKNIDEINDKSGTISYPNFNSSNKGSYLKTGHPKAFPPGPLKELSDYLENVNGLDINYHTYKTEKEKHYDISIWMYEYGLRYDTDTLPKGNFWIDLCSKHGLDDKNPELIELKNRLRNFKKDILNTLSEITVKQKNSFLNDSFQYLPQLKKELEIAKEKFIDDSFNEYLKARQLLFEHTEILKNRLINTITNATGKTGIINLQNIIADAEEAEFDKYKDSNLDKTGIIDIYNSSINKLNKLQNDLINTTGANLINTTLRIYTEKTRDTTLSINWDTLTIDEKITFINDHEPQKWDVNKLKDNIDFWSYKENGVTKYYGVDGEKLAKAYQNKLIETKTYWTNQLQKEIDLSKQNDNYTAKNMNNNIDKALKTYCLDKNSEIVNKLKTRLEELISRNNNKINDMRMKIIEKETSKEIDWNLWKNVDDLIKSIELDYGIGENDEEFNGKKLLDLINLRNSRKDIYDELNLTISNIKKVNDDSQDILTKKNTDLTVDQLENSITILNKNLDKVTKKGLLNIDDKLNFNIENTINLVKEKRRSVFKRWTNGFYYNYNNEDIFLTNGKLKKDFFIHRYSNIDKLKLYFKINQDEHQIGTLFMRTNDLTSIKNKVFISINDTIYVPADERYIINNINNKVVNIPGGSIVLKAKTLNKKINFYILYQHHDHKYQTNKKMNYARYMNGFLFPASNINKKHNYSMNKREINTHIKNISSGGRQARLQANTGSLSRLQRLKAKHM